jgi:hypothetical protein
LTFEKFGKSGTPADFTVYFSFHDIFLATTLDHHKSLSNKSRFDAYSPRYLRKLTLSDSWPENDSMQKRILCTSVSMPVADIRQSGNNA